MRFVFLILVSTYYAAATLPANLTNGLGMRFVLIQPGTMREAVYQPFCPGENDPPMRPERDNPADPHILWTLGDLAKCRELAARDASPGFMVKITRPFYIGVFEVTQGEWTRVMGSNPSTFQKDPDASRHPMETVTWEDAQRFVRKLNEIEKTDTYRLPTEFEWEYAGRAAGTAQIGWDQIRLQAVQGLRAGADGVPPTTQPVGSKQPNAWGLYDMLGNVWEWVDDFYNEKTFPDPEPPRSGKQHVLKGAGFVSDVKNAIYATHAAGPGDSWDVGFRVVKDVPR